MHDPHRTIPSTLAVLTVALLMLLALPASASTQEDPDEEGRGGGFFQGGYMQLDLAELNATLTAAGYPALGEGFGTLGGGGFGMKGRFLLGGEGHALIGSDETTADGATQLELGGAYGLFRVGYLAYTLEGLDIYPMIGIGGGGMSLSLIDRSAPTFGEVLADPLRSSKLSIGSFLLDASVAAHYRFAVEEATPEPAEEDDPGGVLVGVQAGYTFAPGSSSWNLDVINTVAGGPDLAMEGFYVRITIGGWGG
jgi:hypothetical protein